MFLGNVCEMGYCDFLMVNMKWAVVEGLPLKFFAFFLFSLSSPYAYITLSLYFLQLCVWLSLISVWGYGLSLHPTKGEMMLIV